MKFGKGEVAVITGGGATAATSLGAHPLLKGTRVMIADYFGPDDEFGEHYRVVIEGTLDDWYVHPDDMDPVSQSDSPEGVDVVNHPPHYTAHPSGVECIQITEHMSFTLGNAVKYIWRADLKNDAIEDLKKAAWYVEREIARREQQALATN